MALSTISKALERSNSQEVDVNCEDTITIVILGETGSGKSSLIDLVHFWGRESCGEQIKFEDAAKLSIIDKENEAGGSQSGSQTIKPHPYSFHLKFADRDYSFVLLDTPGMGDIKGLKQDDDNIQNILTYIEQTPSVNAIVLMLNGSNCRVSARTQYILQRLYGMCPQTFENYLYLFFSNTQIEPNFEWQKEIKVPIRKENVIPIDNLLYSPGGIKYPSLGPIQRKKIEQNYSENKEILNMVFEQLIKGGALPSDTFKNLRINRDKQRMRVSEILSIIQDVHRMKKQLEGEMQELQNTSKPSFELLRKKASITTESLKSTQRSTPYYNTQCLTCVDVCYENCCSSDRVDMSHIIFRGCDHENDNTCRKCRHSYKAHVHVNCIYDRQITKESLLTDAERQQLNVLTNVEQQKQIIIDKLNQRLEEKSQQIEAFKNDLQTTLQELKALCPYYDYRVELQCAIKLLEEAELVNDRRINPEELIGLKTYFEDLVQKLDAAGAF